MSGDASIEQLIESQATQSAEAPKRLIDLDLDEVTRMAKELKLPKSLKLTTAQRVALINSLTRKSAEQLDPAHLHHHTLAIFVSVNDTRTQDILLQKGILEPMSSALERYPEDDLLPRLGGVTLSEHYIVLSADGERIAAGLMYEEAGETQFRELWERIAAGAQRLSEMRRERLAQIQAEAEMVEQMIARLREIPEAGGESLAQLIASQSQNSLQMGSLPSGVHTSLTLAQLAAILGVELPQTAKKVRGVGAGSPGFGIL